MFFFFFGKNVGGEDNGSTRVIMYSYMTLYTKTLYGSTHVYMNQLTSDFTHFLEPCKSLGNKNLHQKKKKHDRNRKGSILRCERSLELASLCLQSDLELMIVGGKVEIWRDEITVDGSLMEEIFYRESRTKLLHFRSGGWRDPKFWERWSWYCWLFRYPKQPPGMYKTM